MRHPNHHLCRNLTHNFTRVFIGDCDHWTTDGLVFGETKGSTRVVGQSFQLVKRMVQLFTVVQQGIQRFLVIASDVCELIRSHIAGLDGYGIG